MLEKSKRLNLRTDFKWVASGKKLDSRFAKIFLKTGDLPVARVGITASKANFPNAAQKNRARRLVSAAVEQIYTRLPKGVNIILLPKTAILEVKSAEVLSDLERVLKNANLIN